jgi:hypothetical protein
MSIINPTLIPLVPTGGGGGYDPADFDTAVLGGGDTNQYNLQYFTLASTGNATAIDTLANYAGFLAGINGQERAIFASSELNNNSVTDSIQYVTIASLGSATVFGNMTSSRYASTGCSDDVRGLIIGGQSGTTRFNTIEYITMATTGNATDLCDMNSQRSGHRGASDGTYALVAGGRSSNASSETKNIQYMTVQSSSNMTVFGNLAQSKNNSSADCDGTLALWGGGYSYTSGPQPTTNNVEYVTTASAGNASSWGTLSTANRDGAATGDGTYVVWTGGISTKTGMVYHSYASQGTSTSWGTLPYQMYEHAAAAGF